MQRYGATPEAWRHFADRLDLTEHLLPIVANPAAIIAQRSTMRTLGKTPSVYDAHREVVGLGKWTARTSTRDDIERWLKEPDYALCIQARSIRAIDIDVSDQRNADAIEDAVCAALDGTALPKRYRDNSGKRLLAFRFHEPMPKRVVPVDGGIIEFLGDGQQFVASGYHDSGVPYLWGRSDYLPSTIPLLTADELNAVWSTLCAIFATGEPRIAREKRSDREAFVFDGPVNDELAEWLVANWDVYDSGRNGELYLRCPFSDEHSTDGNETSTAYFPRDTGGYERGHWKCLHAHCMGREDHDFTAATGYHAAGFSALPVREQVDLQASRLEAPTVVLDPITGLPVIGPVDDMPPLVRDNSGAIKGTLDNLTKLLARPDIHGAALAWDDFRSEIVWQPVDAISGWRAFTDSDYGRLRIALERKGVKEIGQEMLRLAVMMVAEARRIDSAKSWLSTLRWDGVERVPTFMARLMGAAPTPYADAVSRYIWTALAGRVLEPGCQADMAPILYGRQGKRKSSALMAMVPALERYVEIDMSERDTDLARSLRGKLIGELAELRGLRSRDSEAIKAWVSRRKEEWTPKYKEFGVDYRRRLLLCGTTNRDDFLADETGERRWLPIAVAVAGGAIDVEGIAAERDQLWAEGAARFLVDGVEWEDAERLAKDEHGAYKADDDWQPIVARWIASPNVAGVREHEDALAGPGVHSADIAALALGLTPVQINIGTKQRVSRIMAALGYTQRPIGKNREKRWFAE